jgi:hypothetical protein
MLSPRDNSGRSFAAMNMSHGNGTLPRLHYLENVFRRHDHGQQRRKQGDSRR